MSTLPVTLKIRMTLRLKKNFKKMFDVTTPKIFTKFVEEDKKFISVYIDERLRQQLKEERYVFSNAEVSRLAFSNALLEFLILEVR